MYRNSNTVRRAFTLVELIVAGVIAVIVVGTIGTSLTQLARARETSKVRLNAHLCANAALDRIRREVEQVIRSDDLIDTRLLLTDGTVATPIGESTPRNELLVYTTKLSPVRGKTYSGDGIEHEVQLRIVEEGGGSTLWVRTDAVPDENDGGGGRADPIMDGVVALYVEAFDGTSWYDTWDSDVSGLPAALRVTVSTGGDAHGDDLYEDSRELMSLRTIVPIDRVMPPYVPPDPESAAEPGTDTASVPEGTGTDPTAGVPQAGGAVVPAGGGTGGISSGGGGRGGGRGEGGMRGRGGSGSAGMGRGSGSGPPTGSGGGSGMSIRPGGPRTGGGPN